MEKIGGLRSGLLILAIAITFVSCSAGTDNKNAGADDNTPLEFTWFVDYDWFTPPNAWGADPVSAWIQHNKHVNITWMTPAGASGDRLNLMVATGDLPDVMCLPTGPRVTKLIEAGLVLPLDPYLDEMPNLRKWAGVNLELLRYKDGKLYQFPNWYINPDAGNGNGSNGWGINTRIYKALGSPPLETFEDLEAYLVRVKSSYPGIIPLETSDGFQVGQLVYRGMGEQLWNYMDNRLGAPENGKFTKVFKDPYVRETLIYLNRLMREKLLTQDAFTETRDQVVEKLVNGRVAVFTSYDFGNLITTVNGNNKIDTNLYDVIRPPVRKGVDRKKVTLSGFATQGWNVNVVSNGAESKIRRLLHYLDWATGPDGQRVLCYGPPGYFWDTMDENGIPFWNDKYAKASEKERANSRIFNWDWVGNTSWVNIGKVAANNRLPPDRQSPIVRIQGVIRETSWNENQFSYDRPDPASDIGIIDTQIADIYDEAEAKAVMASGEEQVVKILDNAQAEMDSIGYDKFIDYHNTHWAERKALLARLGAGPSTTVSTHP